MIPSLMPTYGNRDLAFERGEGVYLFDNAGNRYLDFGSGIAVSALGHSHPHLVEAIKAQVEKVIHTSNLFEIPGQVRAGDRLVDATFADTVFFGNSGAEAVECGIKVVRKYHSHKGQPERWRLITIEGAFHGRTLATIAAGGQEKLVAGFGPPVPGFDQVPFGNLNALRAAISGETAGILLEPVQGEGGIRSMDVEYLRDVRAACDEFGILLMLDEIQCGMGRTGKLFAHEWAGIKPDVMAVAKGLGGGFPVGACLATEEAAAGMVAGTHGSTFGGNPLAMAAVNAVLDVVLAEGFMPHVQEMANKLRAKLDALAAAYPKAVSEVRGSGLMLGIKTVAPNGEFVSALRANGMLTVPAGDNIVRLLPPLILEDEHVEEAAAILDKTCRGYAEAA